MSYEPKPGSGTLFKNKNRQNDKHPDYKGYFINAVGEVQGLSLWIKTTAKGDKMLSVSHDEREGKYWSEKLERPMAGETGPARKTGAKRDALDDDEDDAFADLDDEIPF